MKRKGILIAVVIAIILLLAAGVWYFLNSRKSSGSGGTDNQSIGSVNLSLKDLIARGTSQVCTFSDKEVSGTIYISGNKFREDVEIQGDEENEVTKVYTMVMDNTLYTWDEGAKEGITKSFDITSITESNPEAQDAELVDGPDIETPMNYNCRSWNYESNKFELPKDIKFTSLETLMEDQIGTEVETTTQCSYCYKLAGEEQTQCLSALKCN